MGKKKKKPTSLTPFSKACSGMLSVELLSENSKKKGKNERAIEELACFYHYLREKIENSTLLCRTILVLFGKLWTGGLE